MTNISTMITILVMALSLAVSGCSKREDAEKTKAEKAAQEVVEETDAKDDVDQADAGQPDEEIAQETDLDEAEEGAEPEPVTPPEVVDEEPVQEEPREEPVVPPAEHDPAVPEDSVATEEEEVTDISDDKNDVGFAYVGVKKCKNCHLKQYKSWAETHMATSFEGLRSGVKAEAKKKAGLDPDKDYTRDGTCLRCHTTGYGKPGGFVDLETTPLMANVQCEVCHGPGIEYGRLMKENKEYALADARAAGLVVPTEDREGCLQCHGRGNPFNETVDPKYAFDFERRLEQSHEHFPLKRQH